MTDAIHPQTLRREIGLIPALRRVEKHLLLQLLTHVDAEEWSLPRREARRESDFWSMRRLGELLGVCARHTRRAMRTLVDLGFVERDFRDWSASRYQLHPTKMAEAIRETLAQRAEAEEARRQSWRDTLAKAPAPPPRPPRPAPVGLDPRPWVPSISADATDPQARAALAYPQLVPWALRQAEAALAQLDARPAGARPAWASERELALCALGVAALTHKGSDRQHLVFRAGALARPLRVIWREAAHPDAAQLLHALAVALWARAAGILGSWRGSRGLGFWKRDPTLDQLWAPRYWRKVCSAALDAWTEAEAAAGTVADATATLARPVAGDEDWWAWWRVWAQTVQIPELRGRWELHGGITWHYVSSGLLEALRACASRLAAEVQAEALALLPEDDIPARGADPPPGQ